MNPKYWFYTLVNLNPTATRYRLLLRSFSFQQSNVYVIDFRRNYWHDAKW